MQGQFVSEDYPGVSKALHWLVALLAFALLAMGKLLDLDADEGNGIFGWHTALGLLVLMLMVLRVGWRLGHPVPPPAPGPAWQQRTARFIHLAFYALLLLLPLSGWLLASAEDAPVSFFGLTVPALPAGEESEDFLEETHEILGNVLLLLATLHVAAALKHHFVDRDHVLRRMLPRSR